MEAEKKKSPFFIDLAITFLVAAGCIYMLYAAQDFRRPHSKIFPLVIAGITLLACLAQTVITLSKCWRQLPNHLIVAGISVIYLICMYYIGFVISTIAMTIFIPFLLGNRNKVTIIIVGVALTLVFYVVFKQYFYVPLPAGILPF